MTTLTISDRFPNIRRVTIEISYDCGGVNRDRTEEEMIATLDEFLGADGVYEKDLRQIDDWLGGLTEEELETVAYGEESEAAIILAKAPDPVKTNGLLNDIFNEVA